MTEATVNKKFVDIMARMPEFHNISREHIGLLVRQGPKTYKRGETLITASSASARNLVILLAGLCDIEKPILIHDKYEFVLINKVFAPTMFGEVSVFANRPSTAAVISSQRSIALVISAATLRELYEESGEPWRQLRHNFATLGVARCRTAIQKYDSMIREIFGKGAKTADSFAREVDRLDQDIEAEARRNPLSEERFDSLNALLERIGYALALTHFFKLMPDFPVPEVGPDNIKLDRNFSSFALDALKGRKYQGKSLKKMATEICQNAFAEKVGNGEYTECLSEMINIMDDFMEILPSLKWDDDKRGFDHEWGEMVEGFSKRLSREMDKIIVAALQEFDLIDFPETLEGFAEPEKILEFVCVRLAEVKVRVSLENIESGYSVEYQKPAAAMKEKLAYEMFNMMKTHPLVRLLLAEACPQSIIDPCPPVITSTPIMSDFLCFGCKMTLQEKQARD